MVVSYCQMIFLKEQELCQNCFTLEKTAAEIYQILKQAFGLTQITSSISISTMLANLLKMMNILGTFRLPKYLQCKYR